MTAVEKMNVEQNSDDKALSTPPYTTWSKEHSLREGIEAALRTVYDPEIPVNIYELGLIYTVTLTDKENGKTDVDVAMSLTSPGCPVAQEMPIWVQSAILMVEGVGDVEVSLVWDPPWGGEMMSQTAKMELNLFGGDMF